MIQSDLWPIYAEVLIGRIGFRLKLSPLMHAVRTNNDFLIDKLLKTNRIDLNLKNQEGKTALDFAKTKKRREFLQSKGAFPGSASRKVPASAQVGVEPAVQSILIPSSQLPQMPYLEKRAQPEIESETTSEDEPVVKISKTGERKIE